MFSILPDDDCSWWSDICSLLIDLFLSDVQWQDEHDGCCCFKDVRWCLIRLDFRWSSWRINCCWGIICCCCCCACCCLGITWICTSANRSSSSNVFIWLDRSSKDLKRSLSSVNRPEVFVDNVVDVVEGFEWLIDVADDDEADDDDVDAWVFGIVLVCCCCCTGFCGVGVGGGGGKIEDGWWWWCGACGWRSKSPVAVSFSSTNTTRTYTRRRSSVIRSLRREFK